MGLNPTRTALFDVLRRAGAAVDDDTDRTCGTASRSGRVHIATGALRRVVITPADVPLLIDELPALAALATFGGELHGARRRANCA